MDKKAEPFPTLLSVSDAMLYAANQLDEMCSNLALLNIIKEVEGKLAAKGTKMDGDLTERLRVSITGIVDVQIQTNAMRAAAKEIRSAAHETKLVEARAAAAGIRDKV